MTEKLNKIEKSTANTPRDAREVIHVLIQTMRLHRRIIERSADSIGLHSSAHRMLMLISKSEILPSQKEIAEKLKISPAAVANTIKKLEADGYIERSKCKNGGDTRLNEINVTESGKRIAAVTEKIFREVDSSALEGFSEEETEQFISMLERIQCNLNRVGDTDTAEPQRKEMETKQ